MDLHKVLSITLLISFLQLFSKFVDGHGDHGDTAEDKKGDKLDPLKFAKDTGHIKEHLKLQYGFNDEQADKYLKEYDAQTQFFVMHDYDKNTKLDGLELLKSMTHFHDEHEEATDATKDGTPLPDNTETLVEFVDMIIKDQDYNKDGYIDYPEYISYYTKFDKEAEAEADPSAEPPAAEKV